MSAATEQRRQRLIPLLLLFALTALGAYLRLRCLQDVEFKGDEAECMGQASRFWRLLFRDHVLILKGPASTVGLPYPPLYVYLLSLPVLLSRSVTFNTSLFAALHVACIPGIFLAVRRFFGMRTALIAACLLAVSLWDVAYSRKVWNLDLLNLFTLPFLFVVLRFVSEKRDVLLFWAGLCASVTTQIHYSAAPYCFVVLLVALPWTRQRVRYAVAGMLCGAVAALPVLYYLIGHTQELVFQPKTVNLQNVLEFPFAVMTGARLDALIGAGDLEKWRGSSAAGVLQSGLAYVLTGLLVVSVAWLVRQRGRDPRYTALLLLILVPPVTMAVLHVPVYVHYYIVMVPACTTAMAILLNDMPRGMATGIVVALLVSGAACTISLQDYVHDHGGTPVEYGICVRHKSDVAAYLARNGIGEVTVGNGEVFVPYAFLCETGEHHRIDYSADAEYCVEAAFDDVPPDTVYRSGPCIVRRRARTAETALGHPGRSRGTARAED